MAQAKNDNNSAGTLRLVPPRAPIQSPAEIAAQIIDPQANHIDRLYNVQLLNVTFMSCNGIEEARLIVKQIWSEDLINFVMDPVIRGDPFSYLNLRFLENLCAENDACEAMNEADFVSIILGIIRAPDLEVSLAALSLLVALTRIPAGVTTLSSSVGTLGLIDLLDGPNRTHVQRDILVLIERLIQNSMGRETLAPERQRIVDAFQSIADDPESHDADVHLVTVLMRDLEMWTRVDRTLRRKTQATSRRSNRPNDSRHGGRSETRKVRLANGV